MDTLPGPSYGTGDEPLSLYCPMHNVPASPMDRVLFDIFSPVVCCTNTVI
ncbi:MAG: hypothetical protein PHQ50_02165 [Eubacteriales bacterium]|nr:hypothetical protein [Eubacteriales bacterium]